MAPGFVSIDVLSALDLEDLIAAVGWARRRPRQPVDRDTDELIATRLLAELTRRGWTVAPPPRGPR